MTLAYVLTMSRNAKGEWQDIGVRVCDPRGARLDSLGAGEYRDPLSGTSYSSTPARPR